MEMGRMKIKYTFGHVLLSVKWDGGERICLKMQQP